MSVRSRPSSVHLHLHCESCFSRRCRVPVEVSVSCAVVPCRLLCGALFHQCKEEEHSLLCPNERVPCLNVAYGCPISMPRSWLAAHLHVCPASVVCCSMEWLRWLNEDADTQTLHENLLSEEGGGRGPALDLAVALNEQRQLYARLKMKPLYPELMEKEEEGGLTDRALTPEADDGAGPLSPMLGKKSDGQRGVEEEENTDISTEKYNLYERMFSMERGGCDVASKQKPKPGVAGEGKDGGNESEERKTKEERGQKAMGEGREGREEKGSSEADGASADSVLPNPTQMGLAPWDAGVLERLGQEVSPQEFNMYLVHHGCMLLAFGQIEACTPRERDFVYGSLEPIPVQTLRSFKVPDSYHFKTRTHLYDTSVKVQTKELCVDTSDLGVGEEAWYSDEAAATLLGYAELEVRGHKISEPVGSDGLYVDTATQTHSFLTTPFKRDTTLADVTVGRPPKLRLQLQTESVTSRHNKATSAFSFLCGHAFLRREFPTHFRNVHSDIQMCVSGWFDQRCPLAYLGCTYSQGRFQPSTHAATVTYNQELSSFSLRPTIPASLRAGSPPPLEPAELASTPRRTGAWPGGAGVSLSSLPYELLCHMAGFLDSLSLSQLALVSSLMRDVCSSLLQERGMVSLHWERKTYSHGGAKWKARMVWEFSHLFSPVESWCFADVPPISAHLKVCPYYQTWLPRGPVALPSMDECQQGSQERRSLVAQFMGS